MEGERKGGREGGMEKGGRGRDGGGGRKGGRGERGGEREAEGGRVQMEEIEVFKPGRSSVLTELSRVLC